MKPSNFTSCYSSHPALPIGGYLIYGGSCSRAVVTDADVYVGFDRSMASSDKSYPWAPGESFLYHIQDMHAPADPESFKALIEWLAVQLIALKKVHIGCIGGHGRTGTVLAALVTHMTGELNSIEYVRAHYCKKAVESKAQVDFLHKHFGITKADPAKKTTSYGVFRDDDPFDSRPRTLSSARSTKAAPPKTKAYGSAPSSPALQIKPVASDSAIWHVKSFDNQVKSGIILGKVK